MIRAYGLLGDGKSLLIVGLSRENLTRMVEGRPVYFAVEAGAEVSAVAIVFGEDEAAIHKELAALIGPHTEYREGKKPS
jgi:hypothetical protein